MNEVRVIECKRRAQQRLEDVITACNKGDTEELRAQSSNGMWTHD